MALSDEVFANLDSLIMYEKNPPAAIDSSADMPVDTTNVDTVRINDVIAPHNMYKAGVDSINNVFKNTRKELNKQVETYNNKIKSYNLSNKEIIN